MKTGTKRGIAENQIKVKQGHLDIYRVKVKEKHTYKTKQVIQKAF